MSARDDCPAYPMRRNYRHGVVLVSGPTFLTRKATPSRAWQRDVSRGLPRLESHSRRPGLRERLRAVLYHLRGKVRLVIRGMRAGSDGPMRAAG